MPTLKAYIEQVALRLGCKGGMSSGQKISLQLGNYTYTAPCDGYLCVFAGTTEVNQTFILDCSNGINLSHWNKRSGTIGVAAPIAKGQTATLEVPDGSGSKVFFLKTLGAVGGGLSD